MVKKVCSLLLTAWCIFCMSGAEIQLAKDGQSIYDIVKPFERKGGFSFAYRNPCYEWMFDFHLQNGMNMFSDERKNPNAFSLKVMPVGCHTLFGYIPPSPKDQPHVKIFKWVAKKDYFETNPEFFTMNREGKRL